MLKSVLRQVWGRATRPLRNWLRSLGGEPAKRQRRAQQLASSLLAELHRLGFSRTTRTKKGKTKRQRVQFEYPLLMTQDELWCPINQAKLPTGITTNALREDDVVQSLEDRLNAGVRYDYLPTGKFCYVIRLGGSNFPAIFSFNSFEMPADAPMLAVPAGIDAQGTHTTIDLMEVKHLLVAGATGGGKTTFLHTMIGSLIARNSPDDMEFWLIDMKRSEFSLYRPLMGKKNQPGIVRHIAVEPEEAVDLLGAAYKEIDRRNKYMEGLGVTNIKDLDQHAGQKLKRIVLIVDEFAILTTDSTKIGKQTVGSWSKLLMTRIASLGRSAGISIIIATQMVKKEIIDGMISANFENRLAFSCATWRESNLIVSVSDAVGLPNGRGILRIEGRTTEVQTCLVTPSQLRLEIARVAEFGPDGGIGDEDQRRFVRHAKLLLDAACRELGGDFPRAKLMQMEGIRGTITYEAFDEIARRLERDGILEAGGPRKPRRVARAFFGRPGLLDQFYGIEQDDSDASRSPRVEEPESLRDDDPSLRDARPKAKKRPSKDDTDTRYARRKSGGNPNESNESDDSPPPPGFERLFESLEQEGGLSESEPE